MNCDQCKEILDYEVAYVYVGHKKYRFFFCEPCYTKHTGFIFEDAVKAEYFLENMEIVWIGEKEGDGYEYYLQRRKHIDKILCDLYESMIIENLASESEAIENFLKD